ncbi:MAG: histidine--tRNA ligase [Clostridiales bacterium]|jgi:histidine--tRNA ligase|nr:histidine--tRNA ligase [Clostridiales bacterium]PWM20561.1 MAG: histidine--tRNA ligase [Clostridiales bacterium]
MIENQTTQEKKKITEPTILSGFLELLPREQMMMTHMMDTIKNTFESYGFIPLDTPVLEKAEILLAKSGGETAKQVYRFSRGDSDIAMRFDLTVPLARYVAQHYGDLTFPFRRYHIGKVYRGEKPQKGRFREFYQCDIDIVGNGTLGIINDAEIVSVIFSTFKALNIGKFKIMINNRKLLNGCFAHLGIRDHVEALRIIDKIDKIGRENVKRELAEIGIAAEPAEALLDFIGISGSIQEILAQLKSKNISNAAYTQGLAELEAVCGNIKALGVDEQYFTISLKIARGLDYYTGTVYETLLTDYPQLGSICSGGRYDELASNYTRQSLPGVGISIGLSRLFYQLNEVGAISCDGACTPTEILFIPMEDTVSYTLEKATAFRNAGYRVEVYLNEGKLSKKLTYANKLGIPYVIIVGSEEREKGILRIKNMATGEQTELSSPEEVKSIVKK